MTVAAYIGNRLMLFLAILKAFMTKAFMWWLAVIGTWNLLNLHFLITRLKKIYIGFAAPPNKSSPTDGI